MTKTVPYDRVELDRKIVARQNKYIECHPDMLSEYTHRGFPPIPPDEKVWGAIVYPQIFSFLEQAKYNPNFLDLTKFPYLKEVQDFTTEVSFNDLRRMTIPERSKIARLAAIHQEFYHWACDNT